jgi:hypothetical protein
MPRRVTVCIELIVEADTPHEAAEKALDAVRHTPTPVCEVLDNIEPGCSDRQWQVDQRRGITHVTVEGTVPCTPYWKFPPLTFPTPQ